MTVEAELADGTILEFPDGTSPDVMQQKVKEFMGGSQPSQSFAENSGMFRDALTGIMQGTGEFGAGLLQLGGDFLDPRSRFKEVTPENDLGLTRPSTPLQYRAGEFLNERADMAMEASKGLEASTRDNPRLAGTTKFIAEVGPTMLVPGGVKGKLAQKVVTGAAAGAGIGGAQYVDDNNTRLGNATIGGVFGGASPAIFAGGKRAWDAMRGNKAIETTRELIGIEKMLGAEGVLTLGELRNMPVTKAFEQYLDRIPLIGTAAHRQRATDKLQNVATRMLNHYDDSFDNVGGTVQNELRRVRRVAEKKDKQLYSRTDKAAQDVGNPPMEMNNVKKVAREEVDKLYRAGEEADEQTIEWLTNYFNAPTRTFGEASALRTNMLAKTRQAEKRIASGELPETGLASMKRLQGAIDEDMGLFAHFHGGDVLKNYRKANDFFKTNVLPFKGRDFRKILSNDYDTDNILASFIKKDGFLVGRGGRVEQLTNRLTMKGKDALKFAVLKQSMDDAMVETTFRPDMFANSLRKLSDANNVIFSKFEKKELDGFTKLVHAAEGLSGKSRFGGGLRQDLMLIGGGAVAGGAAAGGISAAGLLGGAGAIKGISLLLTTKGGRKALANASTGVDNEVLNKALQELQRLTVRAGTVGATE